MRRGWASSWNRAQPIGSNWRWSATCKRKSQQDGGELRQVAREEKPGGILKAWESNDLLERAAIRCSPKNIRIMRPSIGSFACARRHDGAGFRPRLVGAGDAGLARTPQDRERSAVLNRMTSSAECRGGGAGRGAGRPRKSCQGPKLASVPEAYAYLEKTPQDLLGVYSGRIFEFKSGQPDQELYNKWKPFAQALPGVVTRTRNDGDGEPGRSSTK